jgi:hypothetical protein
MALNPDDAAKRRAKIIAKELVPAALLELPESLLVDFGGLADLTKHANQKYQHATRVVLSSRTSRPSSSSQTKEIARRMAASSNFNSGMKMIEALISNRESTGKNISLPFNSRVDGSTEQHTHHFKLTNDSDVSIQLSVYTKAEATLLVSISNYPLLPAHAEWTAKKKGDAKLRAATVIKSHDSQFFFITVLCQAPFRLIAQEISGSGAARLDAPKEMKRTFIPRGMQRRVEARVKQLRADPVLMAQFEGRVAVLKAQKKAAKLALYKEFNPESGAQALPNMIKLNKAHAADVAHRAAIHTAWVREHRAACMRAYEQKLRLLEELHMRRLAEAQFTFYRQQQALGNGITEKISGPEPASDSLGQVFLTQLDDTDEQFAQLSGRDGRSFSAQSLSARAACPRAPRLAATGRRDGRLAKGSVAAGAGETRREQLLHPGPDSVA